MWRRVIFIDSDLTVRADIRRGALGDGLAGARLRVHALLLGERRAARRHPRESCEQRDHRLQILEESGYWAGHLSGSPYHISALFVVDLGGIPKAVGGRQVADHLQLAHQGPLDPGSLANLDQEGGPS
ncbi:unnamed protein product [Prorocentrum cordatum]|uniref:Glucosyltransferase 24 catalytic domain-containing protein n=1 Tax=Prorocentrum cordatum TaxID=2364126 RepID=A0ABN9UGX6_9DINO|nr:unnamed protein product [Polarella glacialis]